MLRRGRAADFGSSRAGEPGGVAIPTPSLPFSRGGSRLRLARSQTQHLERAGTNASMIAAGPWKALTLLAFVMICRSISSPAAGRVGQFTYHGPGQRVAYVMLDLKRRVPDIRRFVATLEAWIIGTLAELGVAGERREDRIGVWVRRRDRGEGREDKIAAIGIRVRRFVTMHGIALNVAPELAHFCGIVPCGVSHPGYGVTSLADLGVAADMAE